jgi:prepilin-type N-terminal cleavage/methylation domain-containing protein
MESYATRRFTIVNGAAENIEVTTYQFAEALMLKVCSGITLIELLVVIMIIAILVWFMTCFGISGPRPARQARITMEIQQLSCAIENFKNVYGEYPPNLIENAIREDMSVPGVTEQISVPEQDVLQFFNKMFPMSLEPKDVLRILAGRPKSEKLETGGISNNSIVLVNGMSAQEGLFFWLGGFSKDQQYPLSGLGGPSFTDSDGNNDGVLEAKDERIGTRNFLFEFDFSRIGPKRSDRSFDDSGLQKGGGRYLEYNDPRNGTRRRINFWQYYPSGSKRAYAYFDASRNSLDKYYPKENVQLIDNAFPVKRAWEDVNFAAASSNDLLLVNKGKFQILHTGLDDTWGDFSGIRDGAVIYPDGPFVGDIADTLSNFTTGTLGDVQE